MIRLMRPLVALTASALIAASCTAGGQSSPSPGPSIDLQSEIQATSDGLADALAKYRAGDAASAEDLVADAYLEHFELVEHPLSIQDAELAEKLEEQISTDIRIAIREGRPLTEVEALIAEASAGLVTAAAILR